MTTHIDQLSEHIQLEIAQSKSIHGLPPALAIFGSARTSPEHKDFQDAYTLAATCARHGIPVVSGGGPGIMMAANKGAFEHQGIAIGLNIKLPNEQHSNQFQTHSLYYEHFSPRKMAFVAHSSAFAVYPGGFGTMDELFEVLTLVQTGKATFKPVVLIDKSYWSGLITWMDAQLKHRGMINENDLDYITVVDSAQEAWSVLQPYLQEHQQPSLTL